MAGFGIFRNYQKASLVALAILSMLAFFVLPPLLQYGGQAATVADTQVARWKGGEIRERGLDRAMTMTSVVNRFVAEAAVAAGRDPAQAPSFPLDEQVVVRKLLIAEEARKNGIIVSDDAINTFLERLTSGQVRAEQFDQIMQAMQGVGGGVSQEDLFEALRTELLAENMLVLVQRGLFFGDPPGLRWDYFQRLEKSATIEAIGVDVRSVGDQVALPQPAVLRSFYEKHKNDLPEPTSDKPGFREPHRARVDYLVAKRDVFVEEIAKEVSEEDIADFYEKNKGTMFRAAPKAPAADAAAPADAAPPADPAAPTDPAPAADPTASAGPAAEVTAPEAPKPSEPAPEEPKPEEPKPEEPKPEEPKPEGTPEAPSAAAAGRTPIRRVSYQVPDGAAAETTTTAPAGDEPAATTDSPAAGTQAAETPAAGTPSTEVAAPPADAVAAPEDPSQFEPLDAVRERIRDRIARERAEAKVDIIFDRVAADLDGYNQDYALWQAREQARGVAPPTPPDVQAIASVQGLEGARSELWSEQDARDAGGIGQSGTLVRDQASRFGFREVPWVAMVYGPGAQGMRPLRTRDRDGDRFLSWRVEDRPEFTPSFDEAREAVEKAWRIVEGRGLAREKAEALATKAAGKESLEAAVAGDESLQVIKAGPFFWLNPQSAMMGMVQVSQPSGIVLPGEEFMAKVFSLQPGGVGVAFNEPKTVCYCVRLVDVEPDDETLKQRFVTRRGDPQLVGMAAEEARMRAFRGWLDGLESRYGLEWKRKPRR